MRANVDPFDELKLVYLFFKKRNDLLPKRF